MPPNIARLVGDLPIGWVVVGGVPTPCQGNICCCPSSTVGAMAKMLNSCPAHLQHWSHACVCFREVMMDVLQGLDTSPSLVLQVCPCCVTHVSA
jgi:hypothetical protein